MSERIGKSFPGVVAAITLCGVLVIAGEGIVVSLELPLEYAGRGEYDIHIPSERDWQVGMPAWAHGRRAEIVERLQTVFKRSQMHFDADKSLEPG
jgi:hypothetical protein